MIRVQLSSDIEATMDDHGRWSSNQASLQKLLQRATDRILENIRESDGDPKTLIANRLTTLFPSASIYHK